MTAAIPAWKQALIERKRQQEAMGAQKQSEEVQKLAHLPSWKRDLILKKKQTNSTTNGSVVINDNMSFASGDNYGSKTSPRQLSPRDSQNQLLQRQTSGQRIATLIETKLNHDNVFLQNGTTVYSQELHNANISNGHLEDLDNGDNLSVSSDSGETELTYQPGFVNKLRNKFIPTENEEEPITLRRRSQSNFATNFDSQIPQQIPRPASVPASNDKLVSVRTIEHKVNIPAKSTEVFETKRNNFHDNNNVSDGPSPIVQDRVDGNMDFCVQPKNTNILAVKNKVSSILSVFETCKSSNEFNEVDKRKSPPSSTLREMVSKNRSSIVAETTVKLLESEIICGSAQSLISSIVLPDNVENESHKGETNEITEGNKLSADSQTKAEDNDLVENIEKIRQAGHSWLFGSPRSSISMKVDEGSLLSLSNGSDLREVPSNKHRTKISETVPPSRTANLTLDFKLAPEEPKRVFPTTGSQKVSPPSAECSPKKMGFKNVVEKKSSSPEKNSITSPQKEKKKGLFGSLKKEKKMQAVAVKVVEVKVHKNENPNFVVHGVDTPMSLNKKRAAPAPPNKALAPQPPKPQSSPASQIHSFSPEKHVLSRAPVLPVNHVTPPTTHIGPPKVPNSLPSEKKTLVLDSRTNFHDEGDKIIITDLNGDTDTEADDVPVTNIDDLILDDRGRPDTSLDLSSLKDDWDYDFMDDELSIKPRPMKTCSVEFAGAGVKLDKSSLQKPKGGKKNLKIQFEDGSPRMFEYPSEQSLMDSPGNGELHDMDTDAVDSASDSESETGADVDGVVHLSTTPALASTVLGGYRGKFVDDYRLGAKPATKSEEHYVPVRRASLSDRESDSGDEVVIAPADVDDTFQWSETGTADILF